MLITCAAAGCNSVDLMVLNPRTNEMFCFDHGIVPIGDDEMEGE